MDSRYSKVQSSIWNSEKFNAVDDFAKIVYLYLLACPHGNSAGFYSLSIRYAAADLRRTEKRLTNALERLQNVDLILFSGETVFIRQFLRFNPYSNEKHAKGSREQIKHLTDDPLYPAFYADVETFCPNHAGIFEPPANGIDTLSIGYRNGIDIPETKNQRPKDHIPETKNQETNTGAQAREDSPLEKAVQDFIAHRKAMKKPMTPRALELMRLKLDKLAQTNDEKIAIINESIVRGWAGVFPLKDDSGQARASPPAPEPVKSKYGREL